MLNYNPETVSTDFDECDRLYFEEVGAFVAIPAARVVSLPCANAGHTHTERRAAVDGARDGHLRDGGH